MANFVKIMLEEIVTPRADNYYQNIWQQVAQDLNKHYGDAIYKSWFSKINFLEFSVTSAILSAPTNFIRDWIKSNYASLILQLWQHYDKDIKSIEIITKELSLQEQQTIKSLETAEIIFDENEINSESAFLTLDQRFTFENFVVGRPNELAYAASRAVAESKDAVSESNPLFLYGGVGLGKTH